MDRDSDDCPKPWDLAFDGPKSVVANKGCKRRLEAEKGVFALDLDKARDEPRYDGMWVSRTNTVRQIDVETGRIEPSHRKLPLSTAPRIGM